MWNPRLAAMLNRAIEGPDALLDHMQLNDFWAAIAMRENGVSSASGA